MYVLWQVLQKCSLKVSQYTCIIDDLREVKIDLIAGLQRKKSNLISCEACSVTFTMQELFDHHVKEIHNLKCPQCHKYFKTKNRLKTHLVMHTEETPYQCNMCEKAFKLKKRLDEHISSFHIVYECNECNIVFLRRTGYKVQLLAKHPNSESNRNAHLHECDHYHQAFLNKSSLENHMKSHSEERPFECDGCNKRFKHKKHLKSHQKFNCVKQRIYPKPENSIRHQFHSARKVLFLVLIIKCMSACTMVQIHIAAQIAINISSSEVNYYCNLKITTGR